MQGGIFGLTKTQKGFLYGTQLIPTIITVLFPNLIKILLLTQIFYLLTMYIYVKHLSLQKSIYPYYASERNNIKNQIKKGKELAVSAFLLITIYGIIIIKVGKITLPHLINLGAESHEYFVFSIILSLINPLTEELYWRLFLQKVFKALFSPLKNIMKRNISQMSAILSSISPSSALSSGSGEHSPLCSLSTALVEA